MFHRVCLSLSKTVHNWPDVAEALLKDIDSEPEPDNSCLSTPSSTCSKDGLSAEGKDRKSVV